MKIVYGLFRGSIARTEDRSLLSAQWNIERGYKLEEVIQQLRSIDADVIALQEVDIGCDRSGNEDTGESRSIGHRA